MESNQDRSIAQRYSDGQKNIFTARRSTTKSTGNGKNVPDWMKVLEGSFPSNAVKFFILGIF